MDFNPLDLLAAAALSDKGPSIESKGSESKKDSVSGDESTSESTENNDADDDKSENMGKTKSSSVKQPIKLSPLNVSCEMSPQKISWSPESFLSYLDKPAIDHEKLLIEELNPSFVKDKISCLQECSDEKGSVIEEANPSKNVDEDMKYDSIKIKNELSSCSDVKNDGIPSLQDISPSCVDFLRTDGEDSVDVKDMKKEEPFSPVQENKEGVVSMDIKLEEPFETGGQSDTDTAETSDSKTVVDELPEMSCQEIVSLDHPYCLIPGQLCRLPSMDTLNEDIDVCSDSSPLSEDSEQRSRNFSLDCSYLKSGILEGKSADTPQLHQAHNHRNFTSPLKSPSKFESMLRSKSGDTSAFKQVSVLSGERPGPSYGKFKIGTFASFSSSNLELEKYLRGLDSPSDKKIDGSSSDNDSSNRILNSPTYSPSVQPLLQSPSLDWDRSEAGSETHDDSSDARTPHRLSPDFTMERMSEWSHPMYHDHDYCAKTQQPKPVSDDIVKLPHNKRKYTKRKNKLDSVNHEKIMKAKYLKKELLKDSFLKSTPSHLPETPQSVNDSGMKTNPVGRPRKRPLEKTIEEEIDPETGAKMKITGKFQDQYVYYLSKSKTTSRRRQTPSLPMLSDKIIVPAPKPGDIIVPHLTDADIEVVRTKGRSALNIPDRPLMPSLSSLQPKSSIPTSLPISQSSELMSDVDSHIVSTILSMENDNLASPSSSQSQDLTQTSDLYNGQTPLNSDSNITSEQVLNYLLSVVKEEEPSLLHTTNSLFPPLPSDPLYTKAGHLTDPELETRNPCELSHKLDSVSSEILSSQSPLVHHSFENSVIKSETEESGSLPDDLSSFISHSQVTTVSSTTQECDSQGSVKSEFSSDLSPLSTPNLTSSGLRLTSIEKTLDYLGVKDGELKLEHNDPFITKMNTDEVPSQLALSNNATVHDDDTPWIVTVTLYFNDVPAIMIINEPYIRLVDIHKQILPAKDTGILKKRCQLLNIPVLNCTEMHRYFLVQYGKAYNSKSTLIISKDQATALVTYYATPQPRLGRAEETHMRRISCGDRSTMSPVPADTMSSGPVKKRGCNKNTKKGAQTSGISSSDLGVQNVKVVASDALQATDGLNKRTRHKKVNYLEMLRGEEKEKTSDDSILETIESVLKSSDHPVLNSKLPKEKYSVTNKSLSKKKLGRSQSCDKKIRENTNHKRKSLESKKKGKGGGKLLKSSKTKGSTSKLGKKHEKLVRKEEEACSNIDMECDEPSLNKSKFKPLKLKVNSLLNFTSQRRQSSSLSSSPSKKGLFSRSNSSTSIPAERPMRVLAVAHQAALSNEEGDSHLPSQPADIHLDLFTKSSSACVRCHTCSQFLSVPHFMKHHHVPMDNEWLATEAAHRILVPRNKENISEEERRLWEEFHRLQEAIGGFGEGDDDSDSDGDADEDTDFEGNGGQSSLETSGASYLSMDSSHDHIDLSFHEPQLAQSSHINLTINSRDDQASLHSHVTTSQNLNRDFTNRKSELYFKSGHSSLPSVSNSGVLNHSQDSTSHVRTSSRRRKSKQLFSIENYCTPTKKGVEEEGNSFLSVSGSGGI